MDADEGNSAGREAALRWLEIAETLLRDRDLVGSKRIAERAMEADPLLDGVDQVLAVAEVLIAGEQRINNQIDWYAVLQLPLTSAGEGVFPDAAEVKFRYRRLALLLHSDRNRNPGARDALSLVQRAFSILSDPAKKSLFDSEIRIAASASASASKPPPSAFASAEEPFWTMCPCCCRIHMYAREYLDLSLRCPICHRAFSASEISPPSIVSSTDMYYCSWGFFPLGYPGGPRFLDAGINAPNLDRDWKHFYPTSPYWGNNTNSQPRESNPQFQSTMKKHHDAELRCPTTPSTKTLAQKRSKGGLRSVKTTDRDWVTISD
ncbi:uncharacterized protein LOC121975372 [Zingiber officinale]|uniref:J domain-containing protein n=1 Tax=Zingiber officinale TaxID=94328 RepID=A0A8J5GNR4_ZINOF|nr:uncharacterized protein LOC121975372 [Zingiber officinale]KAG6510858.1 hypothetical protein ZIOFF_028903 [Zingiber officinale]